MLCVFSVNAALLNGAMIRKNDSPVNFQRAPGIALLLSGCRLGDCGSKSEEYRYIIVFISSLYVVVLQLHILTSYFTCLHAIN